MRIDFGDISIQGFGSIVKPLTFPLNVIGINVMTGKNGSGKSSIFNALFWALYGVVLKNTTLGKIPTKPEYRGDDFAGTCVHVPFTKGENRYDVYRTISYKNKIEGLTPSSLMLFINGKLTDDQHNPDVQQAILDILEIDSKVFINSILFGQRMKRFIEGTPKEKREVFESINDLSPIDAAKVNTDKKLTKVKQTIATNLSKVSHLRSTIIRVEEQIEQYNKLTLEFADRKANDLKALDDKITKLQAEIASVEYVKDIPETKPVNPNLEIAIRDNDRNIQATQHLINSLRQPKPIVETCNTCSQKLSEDKIQELQKTFEIELNDYNTKKTKAQGDLKIYTDLASELDLKRHAQQEAVTHNSMVTSMETENEHKRGHVNQIQNQINYILETRKTAEAQQLQIFDISKLNGELIELRTESSKLEELHNQLEHLKGILEWWSKTGFGSKGIKGFVLNSALKLLNSSIKKYTGRLGLRVHFSIDTTKASKPFVTKCWNTKAEFEYNEFSGGEKSLIDISAAFAIHDLVSSKVKFNLLIMDEAFEGLDDDNMNDIFDLIRIKSEGKALYIITHSTHLDSLNTRRMEVYKTDSTYVK